MKSKAGYWVVLLCGSSIAACDANRPGDGPEPGTEFFAVAPEAVTEVLYSSSDRKLYAFRWSPAEPFHVTVGQRGAAPEQCTAGDGFTRWLRAIAKVPVTRELQQTIDTSQGEWANLQLRDTSRLEPNEVTLRVPSSNEEPVVMLSQQRQFAVDLDVAALRSMRSGCAGLGATK